MRTGPYSSAHGVIVYRTVSCKTEEKLPWAVHLGSCPTQIIQQCGHEFVSYKACDTTPSGMRPGWLAMAELDGAVATCLRKLHSPKPKAAAEAIIAGQRPGAIGQSRVSSVKRRPIADPWRNGGVSGDCLVHFATCAPDVARLEGTVFFRSPSLADGCRAWIRERYSARSDRRDESFRPGVQKNNASRVEVSHVSGRTSFGLIMGVVADALQVNVPVVNPLRFETVAQMPLALKPQTYPLAARISV